MSDEPVLYLNGKYKALSETNISVLDQGFLLGDGVFDVVSAWKGSLFRLDEHIDRLDQSLRAARLGEPLSREGWRDAIIETLRQNELRDASVRLIVTRGVSPQVVADPRVFEPTVIIWAAPYVFLADEEKRSSGIRLHLSAMRGFHPDTLDPRYKCLDRLPFQLAKLEALEAGYDDVVWLSPEGHVAEGPASNIFVVSRGRLTTPARGILEGITRATFLELGREAGISTQECDLSPFDLYSADEIFTTSTAGGALAVREIAGRPIRAPVPGPITRELDRRYWALRESGKHGTPF
jgi:branched-chain amino acid aminotransferase